MKFFGFNLSAKKIINKNFFNTNYALKPLGFCNCQFHPSLQISSIFLVGWKFKILLANELFATTKALSPGLLSTKL